MIDKKILGDLRDADRRGVAPPQNWTSRAADTIETQQKLLIAALLALRSYQNGNSSPALAEEIANKIEGSFPDGIRDIQQYIAR